MSITNQGKHLAEHANETETNYKRPAIITQFTFLVYNVF